MHHKAQLLSPSPALNHNAIKSHLVRFFQIDRWQSLSSKHKGQKQYQI